MVTIDAKYRVFAAGFIGLLLAFPSLAGAEGNVPSSDEILHSLDAGEQRAVGSAPKKESKQKKGVMVFRGIPSENEILKGLGFVDRSIHMLNEPETPHQVYPGKGEAAPSAPEKKGKRPAPEAQASSSGGMSVAYIAVFARGSDEMSEDIKKYADNVAKALEKKKELRLRISGHTDQTGDDEINMPLSLRRAQAFQNYLIEVHHIDSARLSISGEGSSRLANREDPFAAENRRVQIDRE